MNITEESSITPANPNNAITKALTSKIAQKTEKIYGQNDVYDHSVTLIMSKEDYDAVEAEY